MRLRGFIIENKLLSFLNRVPEPVRLKILKQGIMVWHSSTDHPECFTVIREAQAIFDDPDVEEFCYECEIKLRDLPGEEHWEDSGRDYQEGYLCNLCAMRMLDASWQIGLADNAIIALFSEFLVSDVLQRLWLETGGFSQSIQIPTSPVPSIDSSSDVLGITYVEEFSGGKSPLVVQIENLVASGQLPLQLPQGAWSELKYEIGPVSAVLEIESARMIFTFELGRVNYGDASDFANYLASQIPAPGPVVRTTLAPKSLVTLQVEVLLAQVESERIVLVAFCQTADLAITLLKSGVAAGEFLEPKAEELALYGLLPPGRGSSQSSENWATESAGTRLLFNSNTEWNTSISAASTSLAEQLDRPRSGIVVQMPDGLVDEYVSDYTSVPDGEDTYYYKFQIDDKGILHIYRVLLLWDGYGFDVHPDQLVATYKPNEFYSVDTYDFTGYVDEE